MRRIVLLTVLACLVPCVAVMAQEAAPKKDVAEKPEVPPMEKSLKLIQAAMPSLAKVQVWFQVDKGEDPPFSETLTEKRPFEVSGLVLAADKVYTQDMAFHPRFVKRVAVTFGDQTVEAKPWAYLLEQNGMILQLGEPLKAAKPLVFKADAEGPYTLVPYYRGDGLWAATTESLPGDVDLDERGRPFVVAKNYALAMDAEGRPVGTSYGKRLPMDGSWRGSPLEKPMIRAEDYQKKLDALEKACENTLVRVTLNFRSPKKGTTEGRYGGDMPTEQNLSGLVIDRRTVMVWAYLAPKVTARLEKVVVHLGDQDVPATFKCTLKDWGCLLVTLDKDAPQAVTVVDTPITDRYLRMLFAGDIRVQGEKRVAYYNHFRIFGYEVSYDNQVYPNTGNHGDETVFDLDGQVVAVPMVRRTPGGEERWNDSRLVAMPGAMFKELLAKLSDSSDPSNVPVTEDEENRVAWMGVVLQPLNRELARINKVSDETGDGRTGAIVSYVYPGSPAAEAGVQSEWILLRVQVEGEPKPMDVRVEEGYAGNFPWDRFDNIPVEAFERAPTPWTPMENTFTRAITDFGFGKKYTATFFADGKMVTKDFTIVQSPAHYNSAPRFKSEELGLTVRDMTQEVRHYFLKTDKDPGVIISKVESGSVADVRGLKPFEIITKIGDKSVMSVKEFEAAVKGQKDFRLEILRMKVGRTVPIKLDGEAKAAGENPVTAPATNEGEKKPDQSPKTETPKTGAEKPADAK
jgi:S1-C subfamily serine protease